MTKQSAFTESHSDLGIPEELKDREFRNQFFRTERELDIPAQLKALRKLRGFNQAELADKVGTKQSGISRLETSLHGKWNLEFLVKVSEALDARLAVVIEPYEAVIARYIDTTKSLGPSAVTAQVGLPLPQSSIFNAEVSRQYAHITADKDQKQGAAWN